MSAIASHFSTLYANPEVSETNIEEDAAIFLDPANALHVSEEDNTLLNQHISENEILAALKNSKNSSAPGLDGLPGEVYKFFWGDIKKISIKLH